MSDRYRREEASSQRLRRKEMTKVRVKCMFAGFQRVSALAAGSGKGVTIIARCCQRQECLFSGCFVKTLTVAELSKKDHDASSQILKSEVKDIEGSSK